MANHGTSYNIVSHTVSQVSLIALVTLCTLSDKVHIKQVVQTLVMVSPGNVGGVVVFVYT